MKSIDKICDYELISRYYDNELGEEERVKAEGHIVSCPQCVKRLAKYRHMSQDIRSEIKMPEGGYCDLQDYVIESIEHKKLPLRKKLEEMLISKKILIPAVAMACMLIAFVTFFNNPAANGPSAIITSYSGNGSSVMILETPETRQTIIWLSEKG